MRNPIKISLVLIILLLFSYVGCTPTKNEKYKIPFPTVQNVSHNNAFACESLIDGDFTGSSDKHLTQGIEASVTKGANKVSLKIKDQKTLLFLSGASFDAEDVVGVPFSIIKNDDKELIAVMWNEASINSIVVNKDNGLAIWSKTRSEFPIYNAPVGNLSYLICR